MSRQEKHADVATIMVDSTTKEIRLCFLCQLWNTDTTTNNNNLHMGEVMVMEGILAELSHLGEEEEDSVDHVREGADSVGHIGSISGIVD